MTRNQPKRVLMTADTIGGVWTYALELIRALGRYGMEVGLVTMGKALSREQREGAGSIPNLEVFESDYKLEWMDSPWEDVARAGDWLLSLEQRLSPDVIHLNNFAHGALPWRAPNIVVGHSCVISWWRAVHGSDAPSEWNAYREAICAGLRAAHLVVAPSSSMLAALQGHYGPLTHSIIIPNGRKLVTAALPQKESIVLAAGRLWDAAKNIQALTAIARDLPWPIYVAGEDRDPAGRGSQHANVRRLGKLSPGGLQSWLERASIYALPARYEPFGLSILEAALCGCALVLGDIPSLREVWGDAALFVPSNDVGELRKALLELMSHSGMLTEFAAKARHAARQYSPEAMAEQYVAAYTQVVNQSNFKEEFDESQRYEGTVHRGQPISLERGSHYANSDVLS